MKLLEEIKGMAIVIGIAAYLSKLVKKAAPVFACGLVVAMPLAGIGGVNVVSAQKDDPIQYPTIDFPKDHRDHLKFPKFGGMPPHITLAKLLTESRKNPNSQYSPIYNDEQFDKYLDSIVSDAQKAAETGVKSLIPTPEGEFLDTITKGAYGSVSQINTFAQMSYYVGRISRTSVDMLEETRKSPERSSKVSETMNSAINAKLDRVVHSYNRYVDTFYGYDKHFSADALVYFFDNADVRELEKRNKSLILRDYVDMYGYSLPPGVEFVTIPATKENLKIREIAESLQQKYWGSHNTPQVIGGEKDEYIYLGNLGYWFSIGQSSVVEGKKIWIPPKMKSKWEKFDSSSDFEDYIKYWENKALEDRNKSINKLNEDYKEIGIKFEEVDGPLVRRFIPEFKEKTENSRKLHPWDIFNLEKLIGTTTEYYPSCTETMQEIKAIVENIDPGKIPEMRRGRIDECLTVSNIVHKKIDYLDNKLEKTKNNSLYEVLHKIDTFLER